MFGESASQLPWASHPIAPPPDAPHGSLGLLTLSKYHSPIAPNVFICLRKRVPRPLLLGPRRKHALRTSRRTSLPGAVSYPAAPCARPATLNAISPAALEAVSWPGPIQGSEETARANGMPLGLTFERTCACFWMGQGLLRRALLQCKVVSYGVRTRFWKIAGAAGGQW